METTKNCPQCNKDTVIDSVQYVDQLECTTCGLVWPKPEEATLSVPLEETNAKASPRRSIYIIVGLLTLGGVIAVAGLLGAFKGHTEKPVSVLSRCTSPKLLSADQVREGIAYCQSKGFKESLRYHSSGKVC